LFSHQNGLATSHVAKRAGRRATTRAMAHTIDISHIGCRLGDCARISLPGRPLRLQRGRQKASFRVIWSKHLAANENQAGIEALNYEGNTWGVDLPLSRYIPEVPASTWRTKHKSIPVASHSRRRWGRSLACYASAWRWDCLTITKLSMSPSALQFKLMYLLPLAPRISPTLRPAHIPCRFCSPEPGSPRRVWKSPKPQWDT
jgi:hypothetical protein